MDLINSDFTIVIIDDVPANLFLIETILEDYNFNTKSFDNALNAISFLETNDSDLVLLDIMMPDIDGLQALDLIKQSNKIDKYLPVIMVTSLNDIDNLKSAFKKGSVDYITKPFVEEELITRIQNFLKLQVSQKKLEKSLTELEKKDASINKEIEIATKIQNEMLPHNNSIINNVNCSYVYLPATTLSGDLIDVFKIDSNKTAFVIADIVDHGIPAAILTTAVKAMIRDLSDNDYSPKAILSHLNVKLDELTKTTLLCSLIFGYFDKENEKLIFANSGHHAPIHITQNSAVAYEDCDHILGLIPDDNSFEVFEKEFKKDDILVLYTDGILEQKDKSKNQFGFERFYSIVSNFNKDNTKFMLQDILSSVQSFTKSDKFDDDITILTLSLT